MTQGKKTVLIAVALVAFIAIGVVQRPINYLRYDEKAKSQGWGMAETARTGDGKAKNLLFDLPVQFFGAAALGLREATASLLWVRADEFFHTGQYEAILPIVRLVTWLDPQQIEVYTTGAWHLDYNFVDSEERSDRRYIPPAVRLLEEGVENNPGIYNLYFELAWTHYFQKAKKYDKAIYWMKRAQDKVARDVNTGKVIPRPAYVARMLAHCYEKAGMFDECEAQWKRCMSEAAAARTAADSTSYQEEIIARKNLGLFLLRRGWRYGDLAAYERGIKVIDDIVNMDPVQKRALEAAKASLARWKATGIVPRDVKPPVDVNFKVAWKRVKSKVIRIKGSADMAAVEEYRNLESEPYTNYYASNVKRPVYARDKFRNGARLKIMLVDYDYDFWNLPEPKYFSWDIDRSQTVMWDDTAIHNGKFDILIDMSKDPQIYPFAKDKYKLVIWLNPQESADFIQDRIGWKGEGMTDKQFVNTTINPGYRMLFKEFIIQKRDII